MVTRFDTQLPESPTDMGKRCWMVIGVCAISLVIVLMLYVRQNLSVIKYRDSNLVFEARTDLKGVDPGEKSAEYVIRVKDGPGILPGLKFIVGITNDPDAVVTEAYLMIEAAGKVSSLTFNKANNFWDVNSLSGTWQLIDWDGDGNMDILDNFSQRGDRSVLVSLPRGWVHGVRVGKYETVIEGSRYRFEGGKWVRLE